MSEQRPLRLGILLSGGGRTMVNIARCIEQGELAAEIAQVISSRSTVAGIERARELGIEPVVVRRKDYDSIEGFSGRLRELLDQAGVDLVLQCGWLCLWRIPKGYEQRVMNIHPGLLPRFGGKGMWGHHVHQAVLDAGCSESGCTVHFVNDEYDSGPVIVEKRVPVCAGDDADTLADRVFEQECVAYPEAIRLYQQGRLAIEGGRVIIRPENADER